MTDTTNINNTVLLLQSGGRDSAIAAVKLLEQGFDVTAVTFSENAIKNTSKPKKRALEISEKFSNYNWNMVDFGKWEQSLRDEVSKYVNDELPRSCLLCALSKITAAIYICNKTGCKKIAVGYVDYQNDWAEQTPYAIELQKIKLNEYGIELMLPAKNVASKSEATTRLTHPRLNPAS